MTTVDSHAKPDAPPADLTIPAHLLEQWTGRTFTADEAARLLAALSDTITPVPEAVSAVAHAIFAAPLDWTPDPEGEPDDLTAASKRIHGDNTAARYSLIPVNGDPDAAELWNLHHTQSHDGEPAAVTFLGNHTSLTDAKTRAQLFEAS